MWHANVLLFVVKMVHIYTAEYFSIFQKDWATDNMSFEFEVLLKWLKLKIEVYAFLVLTNTVKIIMAKTGAMSFCAVFGLVCGNGTFGILVRLGLWQVVHIK